MIVRFTCILAVIFLVAACQIIEKNETTVIEPEPIPPAFSAINDARIANHEILEAGASRAVETEPRFTNQSIFKSSDPGVVDVSTPFTRLEPHSPSVKLTLTDRDGRRLIFDSVEHSVKDPLPRRPLPLPPIRRHHLSNWTLFDSTEGHTWVGNITASWHNEELRDFLTTGYWMHRGGDGTEIGTFVHGPELSETPELPESGTVIYRGYTSGMYTFVYGSSWELLHPLLVNGLRETGDFTGIIALKADFTNGTIEGCIGCVENQETTGVTLRPEGEQSELYTNLSLVSIKFAPVPIQQAAFQGNRLLGVIGDEGLGIEFPTEENKGNWGGRFSDRLAAGTFGIEWTQPDGSRSVIWGSFFATEVKTD